MELAPEGVFRTTSSEHVLPHRDKLSMWSMLSKFYPSPVHLSLQSLSIKRVRQYLSGVVELDPTRSYLGHRKSSSCNPKLGARSSLASPATPLSTTTPLNDWLTETKLSHTSPLVLRTPPTSLRSRSISATASLPLPPPAGPRKTDRPKLASRISLRLSTVARSSNRSLSKKCLCRSATRSWDRRGRPGL